MFMTPEYGLRNEIHLPSGESWAPEIFGVAEKDIAVDQGRHIVERRHHRIASGCDGGGEQEA